MPNKKWETLETWLMLDFWRPSEACHIFAGLIEIPLHDGGSKSELLAKDEYSDDIFELEVRKQEIGLIWERTNHPKHIGESRSYDVNGDWLLPPEYYVKWALLKRIEIPWLDWAIEENLIRLTETTTTENNPLDADPSIGAIGEKKEKNILRLISILTERLVNPDMKSNFRSVAHMISEITDQHQSTEPPNSGLSKRTLDSLLAEARKVRPISETEPDDA